MKIFAFVNQKGGVGKTTSAITLGHGLAIERAKGLLAMDVWLTHEKKAEPQMSLFGEAE